MDNNILFVITLVVVSVLAAYVAHGMFAVGTMEEYEKSKMYFAAAVLAFLSFIFMLSILIYAFNPGATPQSPDSPGKFIFDACLKVIPPLATLVIGFYFGASQNNAQLSKKKLNVIASVKNSTKK